MAIRLDHSNVGLNISVILTDSITIVLYKWNHCTYLYFYLTQYMPKAIANKSFGIII